MEYALVPSPFGIWRTMSNYEEEGEEEEERIASQWRSFVTMIHGQVNAAYSESKKSFITPRSWRHGDHDSRPRFACCASPPSPSSSDDGHHGFPSSPHPSSFQNTTHGGETETEIILPGAWKKRGTAVRHGGPLLARVLHRAINRVS